MFKTVLLVFAVTFHSALLSQNFELDTRELLDVIKKWNYANNAQSEETFREIYADKLIFYTQELSEAKCIALKQKLFSRNPEFRQKIISDPKFTPLTSGVIKAEFVKEVFEKNRWRQYPSYLLLTYQGGEYLISGESDTQTDRKLKYKLRLGEPIDIPQSPATVPNVVEKPSSTQETLDTSNAKETDVTLSSSVDLATADTTTASTDSSETALASDDSTLITSVQQEVLSDEPVMVPKKYIYFLIGFLTIATLVTLFSRRPKRDRKSKTRPAMPAANERLLLRNDKDFESYLTALFDPMYFTIKPLAKQRAYAGNVKGQEYMPDMELEFRNKDAHVRLAIECIFVSKIASRELLSFSSNQINRYHDYEEDRGVEFYLIVGVEGEPSDPKELFLIPTSELREGYIGYAELKPFRKYGMFFYNAVRRRLL